MNILMITPDFPYSFGGIGEHVDSLVSHLKHKKDINIYVMIARFADSKLGIRNSEGDWEKNIFLYEIKSTESPKYQNIFYERKEREFAYEYEALKTCSYSLEIFEKIDAIIKRERIVADLIHVHDAFGAIAAVALKKKYQIPLITTMHSIGNEDYLIDGIRKYLLRNSSRVIYVSQYVREKLASRYNLEKDNACVIPNGIDIEKGAEEKTKNLLLYVGRMEQKKGIDVLLKAMKILKDEGRTEIRLEICGEGTEKHVLEQNIMQWKLQCQVQLLGYQAKENLYRKYKEASVVVVPSREESFGLVVIEAMARGASVLCSDIECFREVAGADAGFFFETENAADLAKKIVYVLEHKQERKDKIKAGYDKITEKYTWDKVVEQTAEVYRSELTNSCRI